MYISGSNQLICHQTSKGRSPHQHLFHPLTPFLRACAGSLGAMGKRQRCCSKSLKAWKELHEIHTKNNDSIESIEIYVILYTLQGWGKGK